MFESGKKTLWIQKYPDMCGPGLRNAKQFQKLFWICLGRLDLDSCHFHYRKSHPILLILALKGPFTIYFQRQLSWIKFQIIHHKLECIHNTTAAPVAADVRSSCAFQSRKKLNNFTFHPPINQSIFASPAKVKGFLTLLYPCCPAFLCLYLRYHCIQPRTARRHSLRSLQSS